MFVAPQAGSATQVLPQCHAALHHARSSIRVPSPTQTPPSQWLGPNTTRPLPSWSSPSCCPHTIMVWAQHTCTDRWRQPQPAYEDQCWPVLSSTRPSPPCSSLLYCWAQHRCTDTSHRSQPAYKDQCWPVHVSHIDQRLTVSSPCLLSVQSACLD
jgi:hypothetical protein